MEVKVSSKGEYALRSLLLLGQQQGQVLSIAEIAAKTNVTIKYQEQIMHLLKKFGYVESKRGIQGGYLLHLPPKEIRIGEVIRNLEGPLSPMSCASLTSYEPCSLEASCLLKPLWVLVRDKIAEVLDQTTLEDLLESRIKPNTGGSILVGQ